MGSPFPSSIRRLSHRLSRQRLLLAATTQARRQWVGSLPPILRLSFLLRQVLPLGRFFAGLPALGRRLLLFGPAVLRRVPSLAFLVSASVLRPPLGAVVAPAVRLVSAVPPPSVRGLVAVVVLKIELAHGWRFGGVPKARSGLICGGELLWE